MTPNGCSIVNDGQHKGLEEVKINIKMNPPLLLDFAIRILASFLETD